MFLAQQDSSPLINFTLAPLHEDYGLPLAVIGILVVFMALTLMVTFITILPHLVKRIAGQQFPQPSTPQIALEDELSDEMLAVITAAIAETIRQPHRVVKIRGLTPADLGWSLEGRIQHHQSHRIQRGDRR